MDSSSEDEALLFLRDRREIIKERKQENFTFRVKLAYIFGVFRLFFNLIVFGLRSIFMFVAKTIKNFCETI